MNLNQCQKMGDRVWRGLAERFTEVIEQNDSSLHFGRRVNASLRHWSLPVLLSCDFYLTLLFPRCVYQASHFIFRYRLRGAWPAHFFIFHLQCTVSPANNGTLHYITSPLRIHAIQSDIQSGSDTPSHPHYYWQNNTLKKPSWPKKRRGAVSAMALNINLWRD